jgi:hypothetical protein
MSCMATTTHTMVVELPHEVVLGNMAFGSVQSRPARTANFVPCVRSGRVRAMMI